MDPFGSYCILLEFPEEHRKSFIDIIRYGQLTKLRNLRQTVVSARAGWVHQPSSILLIKRAGSPMCQTETF